MPEPSPAQTRAMLRGKILRLKAHVRHLESVAGSLYEANSQVPQVCLDDLSRANDLLDRVQVLLRAVPK